jgi:hypothetical protein
MIKDNMFKFEQSETDKSCYTVFKFLENRNSKDLYLPIAEVHLISKTEFYISYFTKENLSEEDRHYILERSKLL